MRIFFSSTDLAHTVSHSALETVLMFYVNCIHVIFTLYPCTHYLPFPRPSDGLIPLSVHLCEFCAAFFNDADELERHHIVGCPNDPLRSPASRASDHHSTGEPSFDAEGLLRNESDGSKSRDSNVGEKYESGDKGATDVDALHSEISDVEPSSLKNATNKNTAGKIKTRSTRKVLRKTVFKGKESKKDDDISPPIAKRKGRRPKKGNGEKCDVGAEANTLDIDDGATAEATDETEENLNCKICGEEFTEKAKLHKHVWKHNRKRSHIW